MARRSGHPTARIVVGIVFVTLIYFSVRDTGPSSQGKLQVGDSGGDSLLPPIDPMLATANHLVVVAGHGIFLGGNIADWQREDMWALEPHQRNSNSILVKTALEHIRSALEFLWREGDESVVIFSGGQSRPQSGPKSEALTYYQLAEYHHFFPPPTFANVSQSSLQSAIENVKKRVFAEEFARESLENVLFSICRFFEVAGRYPSRLTVVGFEYKRKRFEELHRKALRWPSDRFRYIGIDMRTIAERESVSLAPHHLNPTDSNTYQAAQKDLYFCHSVATRQKRNPNRRTAPYALSNPALRGLLAYCGSTPYPQNLPWE